MLLFQIPVVADLPVGENLQDQVVGDGIEMFSSHTGFTITAARAENFVSAWAYSIFGTGSQNTVNTVVPMHADAKRHHYRLSYILGNSLLSIGNLTYPSILLFSFSVSFFALLCVFFV